MGGLLARVRSTVDAAVQPNAVVGVQPHGVNTQAHAQAHVAANANTHVNTNANAMAAVHPGAMTGIQSNGVNTHVVGMERGAVPVNVNVNANVTGIEQGGFVGMQRDAIKILNHFDMNGVPLLVAVIVALFVAVLMVDAHVHARSPLDVISEVVLSGAHWMESALCQLLSAPMLLMLVWTLVLDKLRHDQQLMTQRIQQLSTQLTQANTRHQDQDRDIAHLTQQVNMQNQQMALLTQQILSQASAMCPTGCLLVWTGTVAPPGWLICDGGLLDHTNPEHSRLAQFLGGTFDQFQQGALRVPDLRGRLPIGSSASTAPLGRHAGSSTHTLTPAQLPAHCIQATTDAAGDHEHITYGLRQMHVGNAGEVVNVLIPNSVQVPFHMAGGHAHQVSITSPGQSQPFPTLPPVLGIHWIIKT